MGKPSTRDVHVDQPLTNIAVAYMQNPNDFIAMKAFPMVPVTKKSDKYYKYGKEDWFRSDAQVRAPGSESSGGGFDLSTDDYVCEKYAHHKDVDDDTRANADPVINVDKDASEYVTQQLLLRMEKLWVSNFFTTGKWSADYTPGTLWDATGSDPIANVDAKADDIRRLTGLRPNTLIVGPAVHSVLKNHSVVKDVFKYTQAGIITEQLLASVFGVDRYLVARVSENTALEGKTAVMANLFGKHCLLAYAAPAPSLMKPSAGYTFVWTGLDGAGSTGIRIKNLRLDEIESDRIEGEIAFGQKLVAADCGIFFNSVIS